MSGTVVFVHSEGPGGSCRVEKRHMRTDAEVEALARSIAEQISAHGGVNVTQFDGDTFYGQVSINEEGVALIAAYLIDRAPPGAKRGVL